MPATAGAWGPTRRPRLDLDFADAFASQMMELKRQQLAMQADQQKSDNRAREMANAATLEHTRRQENIKYQHTLANEAATAEDARRQQMAIDEETRKQKAQSDDVERLRKAMQKTGIFTPEQIETQVLRKQAGFDVAPKSQNRARPQPIKTADEAGNQVWGFIEADENGQPSIRLTDRPVAAGAFKEDYDPATGRIFQTWIPAKPGKSGVQSPDVTPDERANKAAADAAKTYYDETMKYAAAQAQFEEQAAGRVARRHRNWYGKDHLMTPEEVTQQENEIAVETQKILKERGIEKPAAPQQGAPGAAAPAGQPSQFAAPAPQGQQGMDFGGLYGSYGPQTSQTAQTAPVQNGPQSAGTPAGQGQGAARQQLIDAARGGDPKAQAYLTSIGAKW